MSAQGWCENQMQGILTRMTQPRSCNGGLCATGGQGYEMPAAKDAEPPGVLELASEESDLRVWSNFC